ncbi:MAG: cell division protein FtsQ/DivIB [Bacillota bacterium]|nr:cell division protein FtsQ/DivIB [Bacillota bacterium]
MEKGNIVALEDRIPKLKQQRRKKANRRLILVLFLFFSLIAIIIYLQSPLSHVKNIVVKGNEAISSNKVIEETGISTKTNIWKVSKQQVSKKLLSIPEIKKANVKVKFPNTVIIEINENKRIAYLKKDTEYYPVLENGTILKEKVMNGLPISAPILFDFKEGDVLVEMLAELRKLPNAILNSISEIHYSPSNTDQFHISMYMNDGFEVSATIRSFSDKMSHYPSIISQLDPNKKGIIDLEVGSFFKAYGSEGADKVEKDKNTR